VLESKDTTFSHHSPIAIAEQKPVETQLPEAYIVQLLLGPSVCSRSHDVFPFPMCAH
jgi:hypothetical protein